MTLNTIVAYNWVYLNSLKRAYCQLYYCGCSIKMRKHLELLTEVWQGRDSYRASGQTDSLFWGNKILDTVTYLEFIKDPIEWAQLGVAVIGDTATVL